MHIGPRNFVVVLLFLLAAVVLPASAQTLLGTVPVGVAPGYLVFNPVTNKIYVVNACGNRPHLPEYRYCDRNRWHHQPDYDHWGGQ